MFVLADPNQIYERQVHINAPAGSGDTLEMSFTAKFKLIKTSKLKELLDDASSKKTSDYEFISQFLVGWDGIQTHDKVPLEFSDETLKGLCDIGYWAASVVTDYIGFVSGYTAKN